MILRLFGTAVPQSDSSSWLTLKPYLGMYKEVFPMRHCTGVLSMRIIYES